MTRAVLLAAPRGLPRWGKGRNDTGKHWSKFSSTVTHSSCTKTTDHHSPAPCFTGRWSSPCYSTSEPPSSPSHLFRTGEVEKNEGAGQPQAFWVRTPHVAQSWTTSLKEEKLSDPDENLIRITPRAPPSTGAVAVSRRHLKCWPLPDVHPHQTHPSLRPERGCVYKGWRCQAPAFMAAALISLRAPNN